MFRDSKYKIQNKIIKEVAEELGIHPNVVYKVVRSQWNMVKETIENEDPETMFNSIKIKQLGIFGVKNYKFKVTEGYQHLHIPKDKITKNCDPRKQNTN